MTTKTSLSAIRDYFGSDGHKPLSMSELKALTKDERADLAAQVAEVTGWTLTTEKPA